MANSLLNWPLDFPTSSVDNTLNGGKATDWAKLKQLLNGTNNEAFDPNGSGYDYETAKAAGMAPDQTGHWPSRVPTTGQILKGKSHPTFHLTTQGEEEAGYEIFQNSDGKYYSRKRR